ncbi:MAG: DUF1643 domain-containing protein [Flavobacteriaceae bacterium]
MIKRAAVFNKEKTKRFLLSRSWKNNRYSKSCVFIMLNPSKADDVIDDRTIKKCMFYSAKFGFQKMDVINLFPNILTKPDFKKLSFCNQNFLIIKKTLKKVDTVYLAWGYNIKIASWLYPLLEKKNVFALELSKNNTPKHPLYLKRQLKPLRMTIT